MHFRVVWSRNPATRAFQVGFGALMLTTALSLGDFSEVRGGHLQGSVLRPSCPAQARCRADDAPGLTCGCPNGKEKHTHLHTRMGRQVRLQSCVLIFLMLRLKREKLYALVVLLIYTPAATAALTPV